MYNNKEYRDINLGSPEKEIQSAFLNTVRERFAMDDYQAKHFYAKHKNWKSYLVDTIHGIN